VSPTSRAAAVSWTTLCPPSEVSRRPDRARPARIPPTGSGVRRRRARNPSARPPGSTCATAPPTRSTPILTRSPPPPRVRQTRPATPALPRGHGGPDRRARPRVERGGVVEQPLPGRCGQAAMRRRVSRHRRHVCPAVTHRLRAHQHRPGPAGRRRPAAGVRAGHRRRSPALRTRCRSRGLAALDAGAWRWYSGPGAKGEP
jgi:hypothetical protein